MSKSLSITTRRMIGRARLVQLAGFSLALLGTPVAVRAATYFVASTGGDDAATGTAPAAPWRTLDKVNRTTFAPGDSILFRRGDTWAGASLTVSSSGTESSKITYGAYGDGAKPVIEHEGTTGIGIMLSGKRHVIVRDFDLRRGDGGVRCLADSAHLEILRVDVADTRGPGIVMKQSSYVLVDGCTVTRAGNNGILMHGSLAAPQVNHCTVQNCIVSDLRSNDGIVIHQDMSRGSAGSDFVLRNNICFNCPEQGFDITTGSNVLLEDNVTYGNHGGAIVVGHIAHHVTVRRHFSQDEPTSGSSSLILQVPFVTVEDSRFLGPVNPNPQKSVSIVAIQIGSESQPEDVRLRHNVFLWNSVRPGSLLKTSSGGFKDEQGNPKRLQIRRLTIRNNIFSSRTRTPGDMTIRDLAAPLTSAGFDIDHNLYHSPSPAGMQWTVEGSAHNFAAYRQAFGKDAHGLEADPKFERAAPGDFRLRPESPAVAAGVAVSLKSPLSAPVNLGAPPLARTATTAVLTWDRAGGGERPASFQVFCDGVLAGETSHLSFTVRSLTPNRMHRITVRSRGVDGSLSSPSDPIVVLTKPRGTVLNVRERGARGDGVAKDTAVIQKAIDDCPAGGTVLVPPGVYSVDHLELKRDLTLELAAGATLQFIGRGLGHYPTISEKLTGPEGDVIVSNFSLLTARDARNLTITGGGRINGNGPAWWPHKSEGPRPHLLKLVRCSDVFVQDVTLEDPPAWNTHAVYVDRAVFSQVTFLKVSTNPGTNGDGLNPDSARDILIVGCRFGNQDDSIAIKSGSVTATRSHRQRSAENITIRDCLFDGTLAPGSRPLGIAIGSETSGSIRHVRIRDCEFRNASSVAYLKTNRDRLGTVIEDVRAENCVFTNTTVVGQAKNRAPISIDAMYYDPAAPELAVPLTPATPALRDIHFKDIVIEDSVRRGITLVGLAELPVKNLTFTNVVVSAKHGLHGENLDGVELRDVIVTAQDGPAFAWINVQNRTLLSAAGEDASRAQPGPRNQTNP